MSLADREASHALVRRLFAAALAAAEPGAAVERFLDDHPEVDAAIAGTRGEVWVVGAGKASAAMAEALFQRYGARIAGGLVIVRDPPPSPTIGPIRLVIGAHPLPDAAGLAASREIAAIAERLGADDRVLALISGGASALLNDPRPPLGLDELRETTALLLASGAPIAEMNAVRRRLCRLKGGGLAALAAPAPVLGLVVSDVVGDPPTVIGSGPTVAPDADDELHLNTCLERPVLSDRLPPRVRELLAAPPPAPRLGDARTWVIAGARQAAAAMAQAAQDEGIAAELLTTWLRGEARVVGVVLAALAQGLADDPPQRRRPAAWILAGETTVTLKRAGLGGRNQECALAAAIALDGRPRTLVACLASDGSDGPTDAAGAIVDGESCSLARARGLRPARALIDHDAYPLLAATGDLVFTGPTATNIADLALVLAW
ncbi:MAG: DUF4147 domain-containing protein [Myxococcales bacterium]|nr:DUF4147 domain-containing protein [Myxococcales bacterium]